MYVVLPKLFGANHFTQGVTHCIANGAICGKYNIGRYNIFHRLYEVMLFVMVKACLHLQNILLFKAKKELSLL